MIKLIFSSRRCQWLTCIVLSMMISACGGSSLTDVEYLQKAKVSMDAKQVKSAIIQLKNALNVNADNLEARWMLGKINVQMGDGAEAEKELLKAQSLGLDDKAITIPLARAYLLQNKFDKMIGLPENGLNEAALAEIKYLKSKAYLGLQNIDAVKENLKQAIELGGDTIVGLTSQAFSAFGEGKNEDALVWVNKALQKNGQYVDALILSGDLYLAMKKYPEAERAYQKALNIQKNAPVLKVALAISQINSDKLDEAINNLNFILKYFPEDVTANYYRALAAFQKDDNLKAQLHAEKALNTQSNHLESKLIAATSSYSLKHYEKTLQHITSFLSFVPEHESAIKLQTATFLALNLPEKAAGNVTKFNIETGQDGKMLEAIAISLAQAGDLRAGSKMLEQAVQYATDKGPLYAQLGVINVSRGDRDTGIKNLEKALALDPELVAADVMLIISYIKENEFDKAIASAKGFQEKQPTNSDGYTLEAIAQLGKKNTEQAKMLLRQAIEISPGNPNASFNLASLALEEKNTNEARELYQAIIEHNPGHLKALLQLSDLEFKSGNQSLGLKLLEEAKNTNKEALVPRLALARWYVSKKQPEKALAATEALVDKFPQHIQLVDTVAQAYSLSNKVNAAIDTYHKLEALMPKNANVQYQLGRLYNSKKDSQRARRHLDKALEMDANHRLALLLGANFSAQAGEFKKAKQRLATYKKSNEADAGVYELEAKIALVENKPKSAIKLYQKALEKSKNNLLTIQLAKAYRQDGNKKQAEKVLDEWLMQNSQDDLTRMVLADMLLLDEKYASANKQYETINASQPSNASVLNNLAWLQMQFENYEKAILLAEKAIKLAPRVAALVDTYAEILQAKGDLSGAIKQFKKASKMNPNDLIAKFRLAKALKQNGEYEKVKDIVTQLLENENFKQVKEAKALMER